MNKSDHLASSSMTPSLGSGSIGGNGNLFITFHVQYFQSLEQMGWHRLMYSYQDVTDEKRTLEQQALLMKTTKEFTWVYDLRADKVIVSEAYIRLLGYASLEDDRFPKSGTEFIAKHFHPHHGACIRDRQPRSGNKKVDYGELEVPVRKLNGEYCWIASRIQLAEFSEDDIPILYSGIVTDVHRRKTSELKTKRRCAKLERVIDLAPFGLFQDKLNGECVWCNQEYYRITGLTEETARGFGWLRLFPEESRNVVREKWVKQVSEGQSIDEVLAFHRPDGKQVWVRLIFHRDLREDEEERFLGLIVDVSEHVLAKQKVEEQNRKLAVALNQAKVATQLKSEFLAVISHEIRTPLNGIIGNANLLLDHQTNDEQKRSVKAIIDCGSGLLTMVTDLIELSTLEAGALDLNENVFDLKDLLHKCVGPWREIARQKGLHMDVSSPPNVPVSVKGDAGKLQRILSIIIGNAVKFTEEGSVLFNVQLDSDYNFVFKVEDTGIGIARKHLEKIFQPFCQADADFSRQYEGAGLGLVIAKKLTDILGGQISVQSIIGRGSAFTLNVPLQATIVKANPSVATLQKQPLSKRDYSGMQVLLVDDNRINQNLASRMLKKLGVSAELAYDGQQSLDMSKWKHYDLILMDVSMPRMSGIEATKHIRSRLNSNQPYIVAMTANVLDGDRDRCIECGMNSYIAKPFSITDLHSALEEAWQVSRQD